MASEFADLHDDLRAVARDLLAQEDRTDGLSSWRLMADAGWIGLEAPDDIGGAGATFAEVAVLLDEMGRAASSSPFLGAGVLGMGLLTAPESAPALLHEVVRGDIVATCCLSGDENPDTTTLFTVTTAPSGARVSGVATFVADAIGAQRLLLPATLPDGTIVVVDLPRDDAGVTVTPQPVLDATRSLATVSVADAVIPEPSVWRLPGDGAAQLRRLRNRAYAAVACDSLGIGEAMLAATVEYVGTRRQFGRPIGSFQAVKHACADMLVQISVARQLVAQAVEAVSQEDGTATDDDTASMAAARAKAFTSDTAVAAAGTAMQLHGGIGYTWEGGVHVYLKRATLNRSLFGSPTRHRARLAARYR